MQCNCSPEQLHCKYTSSFSTVNQMFTCIFLYTRTYKLVQVCTSLYKTKQVLSIRNKGVKHVKISIYHYEAIFQYIVSYLCYLLIYSDIMSL